MRQQMIDTGFWSDPYIAKLNQQERYLYLYLLTSPLGNIAGIYESDTGRMAWDTRITQEDVEAALQRFEKDKKVYRHGDWIIMKNWPKRQNLGSSKVCMGIERILMGFDMEFLQLLLTIGYTYPKLQSIIALKQKDTVSIPPEGVSEAESNSEYPTDTARSTTLHSTTLHYTTLNAPPGRSCDSLVEKSEDKGALRNIMASFKNALMDSAAPERSS